MSKAHWAKLSDRGVLSVSGEDARTFLQGLVSNDVDKVTSDQTVYAGFLTPQGKFLFDFHMIDQSGDILLETEGARLADFHRRLRMYKLRSKVTLADRTEDFQTVVVWGEGALAALGLSSTAGATVEIGGGFAWTDSRLPELGARLMLPSGADPSALLASHDIQPGDLNAWETLRLSLAVPDGSRDMVVEKAVLLESGFDELNGVDWRKGCYMGQELTARTKYRGLVKKRLLPIEIDGPLPAPGTPVVAGEREIGEIRTGLTQGATGTGIALLRLDRLSDADEAGQALTAEGARLTVSWPAWMEIGKGGSA